MRKLAVGIVAIVAFSLAAVAGIWLMTRPGGAPPAGIAPGAIPQAFQAPPLAPPGLPPARAPVVPPPAAQVVHGPPRAEPPKGSWEAVAVVAGPAALGPLGGAIGRGLNELQPQLAGCFDEDTAARFGTHPRSVSRDASLPDVGTPVLVLEIETGGGRARIVDAPVDTQGGASDGVIACAQQLLRGRTFAYAQAPAGGRFRLLHSLVR